MFERVRSWWKRPAAMSTVEQVAERQLADVTPYPTMTDLGLSIGDDVIWENTEHIEYVAGNYVVGRKVVVGKILRDVSMYPSGSGERFVDLDCGMAVSTKYLRKA